MRKHHHVRRTRNVFFGPEAAAEKWLGLEYVEPELRENRGEIEAAAEATLPRLIARADIRGDLHMQTRETDGRATLEEMAEAARAQGYSYIAITDHSKALAMANGLDEARAVAFAQQCREINKKGLGIRIFSGLECDILKDGEMDLANDALIKRVFAALNAADLAELGRV